MNKKTFMVAVVGFIANTLFAQNVENLPWQQRDRNDMKPQKVTGK